MSQADTARGLEARHGARYRWWVLATVMVGTMASIMSSTVVNVAIPDLTRRFLLGQEQAQWVSSSFMLATTCSMLTTPWLLERLGYRRTYLRATLLLLAGGLIGGLATRYDVVLLARVIEGLAAGVLQPIPAIIILRAFASHEQGRASAWFSTGVVLAPAIGPSIGGLLVEAWGWRSVFFMVVPFCLLAIQMARRYVPVSAPGDVAPHPGAALDWRGLTLVCAGAVALLQGLVALHGQAGASAPLLLALSLCLLAAFVVWQRRQRRLGAAAVLDPGLFAYRQFAIGSLVALIYGTGLFGSTYLIPVYMQFALGMAPGSVGSILLPAGLVLALTIALVGRIADRTPIWLLTAGGLALLALSFALMMQIELHSPLWLLTAFAIIGRIGLGLVLPSLNLGAMQGLERGLIAQASSVINFLRTFGGAAGISLCGIVLEWRLAVHGDALTLAPPNAARLAAFDETFIMLAALCAVASVAAIGLRKPSG